MQLFLRDRKDLLSHHSACVFTEYPTKTVFIWILCENLSFWEARQRRDMTPSSVCKYKTVLHRNLFWDDGKVTCTLRHLFHSVQSSRETCAWHPNFEHHALTLRCETALAVGQGSREERQALPSRDVPQQTGQGSVLGHLPRQKFQLGNQAFSWSGKGCGGVNKLVPLSAWRGPHELN